MKYSILALLALAAAGACESVTDPDRDARVVVVNATSTALDVLMDNVPAAANTHIAFGNGSECLQVDPRDQTLTLRESESHAVLTEFAPVLMRGQRYAIVVIGDSDDYDFLTLPITFTPPTGQGGLRIVNAVPGASYDVYVTDPAGELVSPEVLSLGYGGASNFFAVPTNEVQQVRFTISGTQTVALDAGNSLFADGQNLTVIIAPPASAGGSLRTFGVVHNCG